VAAGKSRGEEGGVQEFRRRPVTDAKSSIGFQPVFAVAPDACRRRELEKPKEE